MVWLMSTECSVPMRGQERIVRSVEKF